MGSDYSVLDVVGENDEIPVSRNSDNACSLLMEKGFSDKWNHILASASDSLAAPLSTLR